MQITDTRRLNKFVNADCAPVFETIIMQRYIGTVWEHTNDSETIYVASVSKQFVGIMHAGTKHAKEWTSEMCGWLEDGNARIGQEIVRVAFDNLGEAIDYIAQEAKILVQYHTDLRL